jgi:hypothetical protein
MLTPPLSDRRSLGSKIQRAKGPLADETSPSADILCNKRTKLTSPLGNLLVKVQHNSTDP